MKKICQFLMLLLLFGCQNVNSNDGNIPNLEKLFDITIEKIDSIFIDDKVWKKDKEIKQIFKILNVEYETYDNNDYYEVVNKEYDFYIGFVYDGCLCKKPLYMNNRIYFNMYRLDDEYKSMDYVYVSCNEIELKNMLDLI